MAFGRLALATLTAWCGTFILGMLTAPGASGNHAVPNQLTGLALSVAEQNEVMLRCMALNLVLMIALLSVAYWPERWRKARTPVYAPAPY